MSHSIYTLCTLLRTPRGVLRSDLCAFILCFTHAYNAYKCEYVSRPVAVSSAYMVIKLFNVHLFNAPALARRALDPAAPHIVHTFAAVTKLAARFASHVQRV